GVARRAALDAVAEDAVVARRVGDAVEEGREVRAEVGRGDAFVARRVAAEVRHDDVAVRGGAGCEDGERDQAERSAHAASYRDATDASPCRSSVRRCGRAGAR